MKLMAAPWRFKYLTGPREKNCVFCRRLTRKKRQDEQDLIIHRGKSCFVFLNKYPYTNGHLMVVPKRHLPDFEKLDPEELAEMMSFAQTAARLLRKTFKCQGFNMGLNLGKAGGAGIEEHLHFHVVPRWLGDANFWPVIGGVKSIPQELSQTWKELKKGWPNA